MSSSQPQINLTGLGMSLQKVEDIPEYAHKKWTTYTPYYLIDVKPEDAHFKEIVTDFENAGLDIRKVQRLQNVLKWQMYEASRESIYKQRTKFDPNYSLNEKYLYHGTSAKLKDLCELGLDDKLSGNGCFGKGIYFSDNPKKCTKYGNRRAGDDGLILCVRVILGDIKLYPKGKQDRTLLREPEKTGSFAGWRFYDSVQGCPKDFTEFVVYRAAQAFIEYLITYSKSSIKLPNHSPLKINDDCLQEVISSHDSNMKAEVLCERKSCDDDATSKPPALASNLLQHEVSYKQVVSDSDLLSVPSLPVAPVGENSSDSSSDEDGDKNDGFDAYRNTSSSDEEAYSNTYVYTREASGTDTEDNGSDTDSDEMMFTRSSNTVLRDDYCKTKEEERTLAQKREQFSKITGEYTESVAEYFLGASDFDVDEAVKKYKNKQKKDSLKIDHPVSETEDQEEDKKDVASGGNSEPLFVQGKTVPGYNSPQWNTMTENDREAVINILVDKFLSITSLTQEHEPLARKMLGQVQYDLDQAIVAYYESI